MTLSFRIAPPKRRGDSLRELGSISSASRGWIATTRTADGIGRGERRRLRPGGSHAPAVRRHRPIRSGTRDGELDRASGDISELDPDDYQEKLKLPEHRHEILATWIVMVFAALLLVSPQSFPR